MTVLTRVLMCAARLALDLVFGWVSCSAADELSVSCLVLDYERGWKLDSWKIVVMVELLA